MEEYEFGIRITSCNISDFNGRIFLSESTIDLTWSSAFLKGSIVTLGGPASNWNSGQLMQPLYSTLYRILTHFDPEKPRMTLWDSTEAALQVMTCPFTHDITSRDLRIHLLDWSGLHMRLWWEHCQSEALRHGDALAIVVWCAATVSRWTAKIEILQCHSCRNRVSLAS